MSPPPAKADANVVLFLAAAVVATTLADIDCKPPATAVEVAPVLQGQMCSDAEAILAYLIVVGRVRQFRIKPCQQVTQQRHRPQWGDDLVLPQQIMKNVLQQIGIVKRLAIRSVEDEAKFIEVDIALLRADLAMKARTSLLPKSLALRLRSREALDQHLAIVVRKLFGVAERHHEF